MPDAPKTDAPTIPADTPAPAPADPGTPAPAPAAPKWEGEFDPERAARLVANLREELADYKSKHGTAQAKLTEYERAQMSDAEKLTAERDSALSELTQLRREMNVSAALRKHGLSDEMAEFLTGDTADEIEARAAKLASAIPAKPADDIAETQLPHTLPVPGNGGDPAAVRQLTHEEVENLSPAQVMEAYRAGRLRNIGGK